MTLESVSPVVICMGGAIGFFGFVIWGSFKEGQRRKAVLELAYREGIGEEYEFEARRLEELQSLRPKDAPPLPDICREALKNARLLVRLKEKNPPTPGPKIEITNSTIGVFNLGDIVGDLNTSVQSFAEHGQQCIADAITKLGDKIAKSEEIKDEHRKDLLENLAQVSKEGLVPPDQRRSGLLKSSLAFITTSLATAKELVPLVRNLHDAFKAAGIIHW